MRMWMLALLLAACAYDFPNNPNPPRDAAVHIVRDAGPDADAADSE